MKRSNMKQMVCLRNDFFSVFFVPVFIAFWFVLLRMCVCVNSFCIHVMEHSVQGALLVHDFLAKGNKRIFIKIEICKSSMCDGVCIGALSLSFSLIQIQVHHYSWHSCQTHHNVCEIEYMCVYFVGVSFIFCLSFSLFVSLFFVMEYI